MAYMRLGDLLVASGTITEQQLERALALQKETKQRLGDALIQNGFITEAQLIDAVCPPEHRQEILRGAGEAGTQQPVSGHERSSGLRGSG